MEVKVGVIIEVKVGVKMEVLGLAKRQSRAKVEVKMGG